MVMVRIIPVVLRAALLQVAAEHFSGRNISGGGASRFPAGLAENLHIRMQSPAGCVSVAADQWKTSELQRNDANHVPAKIEISLQ